LAAGVCCRRHARDEDQVGSMRIRWPFTILWTVFCAWAIWSVIGGTPKTVPGDPGCFEYCDKALANIPVLLIVAVWLIVTVIAAWLWSRATDKGD
jgi:hypothetical protein